MAIPYVSVNSWGGSGGIQPYGIIVFLGLIAGGYAMVRAGKRFGIAVADTVGLAGILAGAAVVTSHLFDVAFYQWHDGARDPALWIRMFVGNSLFGALLGVAIALHLWARVRRLDLALHADLAAVGCIVAMTIGRIGCTLVHDHPGTPTDAPIGVDYPIEVVRYLYPEQPPGTTIRLHDLGLYELALLLPLVAAAFVLIRRRLRAGMTAAILAIAYACVRFPLDFLRGPSNDPRHAGLTAAQWGCLVMVAVAILAIRRLRSAGAIAPLASELGGAPGGRRRGELPPARTT